MFLLQKERLYSPTTISIVYKQLTPNNNLRSLVSLCLQGCLTNPPINLRIFVSFCLQRLPDKPPGPCRGLSLLCPITLIPFTPPDAVGDLRAHKPPPLTGYRVYQVSRIKVAASSFHGGHHLLKVTPSAPTVRMAPCHKTPNSKVIYETGPGQNDFSNTPLPKGCTQN